MVLLNDVHHTYTQLKRITNTTLNHLSLSLYIPVNITLLSETLFVRYGCLKDVLKAPCCYDSLYLYMCVCVLEHAFLYKNQIVDENINLVYI